MSREVRQTNEDDHVRRWYDDDKKAERTSP